MDILAVHYYRTRVFPNLFMRLDVEGITSITGRNLLSRANNEQSDTNAVGKSMLLAGLSNVFFERTHLSTTKNKQDFYLDGGYTRVYVKTIDNSIMCIEQNAKGRYALWENGVPYHDKKSLNISDALNIIRTKLPLNEMLWHSQVSLSAKRHSGLLVSGTDAERLAFLTQLADVGHFDILHKIAKKASSKSGNLKAYESICLQLSAKEKQLSEIECLSDGQLALLKNKVATLSKEVQGAVSFQELEREQSACFDSLRNTLVSAQQFLANAELDVSVKLTLDDVLAAKTPNGLLQQVGWAGWLSTIAKKIDSASSKTKPELERQLDSLHDRIDTLLEKHELDESDLAETEASFPKLFAETEALKDAWFAKAKAPNMQWDAARDWAVEQLNKAKKVKPATVEATQMTKSRFEQLTEEATTLNALIGLIDQATQVVGDDHNACPLCLTPNVNLQTVGDQIHADLHQCQDELQAMKYEKAQRTIKLMTQALQRHDELSEYENGLLALLKDVNELKRLLQSAQAIDEQLPTASNKSKRELESSYDELESLRNTFLMAAKDFFDLEGKRDNALDDAEFEQLSKESEAALNEYTQAVADVRLVKAINDDLESLMTERDTLRAAVLDEAALLALTQFYSPSGGRLAKLQAVCEALTQLLNEYSLLLFSEQFRFSVSLDGDTVVFSALRENGAETDVRALSTSEEMRLKLLTSFCARSMSLSGSALNTVFLDEMESGSSDANQRLYVNDFIPTLAEHVPSVFLVSPLAAIHNNSDYSLTLEKRLEGTFLNVPEAHRDLFFNISDLQHFPTFDDLPKEVR